MPLVRNTLQLSSSVLPHNSLASLEVYFHALKRSQPKLKELELLASHRAIMALPLLIQKYWYSQYLRFGGNGVVLYPRYCQ